jgi:hypothetical protein
MSSITDRVIANEIDQALSRHGLGCGVMVKPPFYLSDSPTLRSIQQWV